MLVTALCYLAVSPAPLDLLKARLDKMTAGFGGRIGYCVLDVKSGRRIQNRGDERFPTASTIKTAVAVEVMNQVDEGKIKWSDKRPIPPLNGRESSMWSYFFKDGTEVDVDGYTSLMITVSDNTATIVLRDWLTPDAINRRMAKLGLPNTKVLWNAFPAGSEDSRLRKMFGLGMTTPVEMNRLFELIYRRKVASPAGCDRLLRILSHQYWDDMAGSTVPIGVQTAIKNGAIDRSRSECAIVFSDHPYILTIYTDHQKDQRYVHENEGEQMIRRMCAEIWRSFEPARPYSPPPGAAKFYPTGGGAQDG